MSPLRRHPQSLSLSTLVVIGAAMAAGTGCGPKFADQQLDPGSPDLSSLTARTTIAADSTTQQGLVGFVGLLLETDDAPAPGKPPLLDASRAIGKYRPKTEQVAVDAQTGKTLYQGKVTRGFSAGGNYLVFTGNLSADQAAEVVIKDEVTVGYRDPGQIPYDKLAEEAKGIPKGKRRYFVTAATLTSVVHKTYRALKGETQIAGTAFGANGKVYVSDENFQYDPIVSLRLEDIGLLAPALSPIHAQRAGALPAHENSLLKKTTWNRDEAVTLSTILQRLSAPDAHDRLDRVTIRPD